MRISFGLGLQSGVNHSLDSSCIVTGFTAPTWSNLPKCLGPTAAEALSPETNRLTIHASLSSDRYLGLASGNGQDNATTWRYLLGIPKATTQRWSSLRWSEDRTRGSIARGMTDYDSSLKVCPAICRTLH